jgi:predicted acyltransferase
MVRYKALDAFRGITIAMMILVNNPGSWNYVYWPLEHSKWNGITPTDLVFPFFLFIVGSAMFFAFQKNQFQLTKDVGLKIVRRGVTLIIIGILLNTQLFTESFSSLRFYGVMQRIGLVYILASFIVLLCNKRGVWIASAALLLVYWALMVLFGGPDPFSLEHSAARSFDRFLFSDAHLYNGFGIPFDPEGMLSNIPAIVNALIGFEVTRYLTSQTDKQKTIVKLFGLGAVALVVALSWNVLIPINKALWTSSYVVFTCGAAMIMLAIFIWIVDIKNQVAAVKPLLVFGMNPLFIYIFAWILSDILSMTKIEDANGKARSVQELLVTYLAPYTNPFNASLIFAVLFVLFCYVVAYFLYRRNIVIKL